MNLGSRVNARLHRLFLQQRLIYEAIVAGDADAAAFYVKRHIH
jgi:DNA-binding FadR family transcriptional regulator